MGNGSSGCDEYPEPDTANLCNVNLGQQTPEPMPNFCTMLGLGGNSYRADYCGKMSNAGEWGNPNTFNNTCSYNDCNKVQDIGFGCCGGGCCGIVGGGLLCSRESFTGDPVTCCFKDLICTGQDPSSNPTGCFSDQAKQNTCANGVTAATGPYAGQHVPNYRSLVSTDCQDVLLQYCTGTLPSDDPNSTAWLDRWTQNAGGTGSCSYALTRNIYQVNGTGHCFTPPVPVSGICSIEPSFPVDSQGYFWGQQLVSAALAKYTAQGFAIGTLPGFPGYNPFQDFLYSTVCCPLPGLCQEGLQVACGTYTAQRISLNPAVAQWCGCHLPGGEYEDYSVKYNIPPQCTPMCNREGTIPIVGINANPILCKQDICLIDGVTVNLISSQIGGGIDFNQVCGNCPNGQCSCIISDTTVDVANSTIGGNLVPVNEGCGNLTCTQTNPGTTGPATITVPCGTTAGYNPYAEYDAEVDAAQSKARKSSFIWTLLIIGVALIIIFLIIVFVHPNLYPGQGAVISRETPPKPTSFERSTTEFQSIDGGSSNEPSFSRSELENLSSFAKSSSEFSSIESSELSLESSDTYRSIN